MPGLGMISGLVAVSQNFEKTERAYIVPLHYKTDAPLPKEQFAFQYWPSTFTDNKITDYISKQIPGLSHPLKQFLSGGDRVVSFMAEFTRDVAPVRNLRPAEQAQRLKGMGLDLDNVDIGAAKRLLRSFLYPIYESQTNIFPPRKMLLVMPNMELGAGGKFGGSDTIEATGAGADTMPCIMTLCDWTHEESFPNGAPRIASCQLEFVESIQFQGRVNPVDARDVAGAVGSDGQVRPEGTLARYTIKPQAK